MFLWDGLHPAHRAVFMTGVMAYVSAPLWLLSLALSSAFAVLHAVIGPHYFMQPRQLFPSGRSGTRTRPACSRWPPLGVLFLPKILGAILALARGARPLRRRERPHAERAAGDVPLLGAGAGPDAVSHAVRARRAHESAVLVEEPAARGRRDDVGEAARRHGLTRCSASAGAAWCTGWRRCTSVDAADRRRAALAIPISVLSSRVALAARCAARGSS